MALPALIAAPLVKTALITAGSQLAGAALGNKGSNRAAKTQQTAAQEALAYQREQDAKEEARYREQEAKLEAQWNAEQARIAPYRQAAEALLMQNAGRLGLSGVRPAQQPMAMPSGWTGTPGKTPRTLSSLAGMGTRQPDEAIFDVPAVSTPKMSLSDVLENRWTGR